MFSPNPAEIDLFCRERVCRTEEECSEIVQRAHIAAAFVVGQTRCFHCMKRMNVPSLNAEAPNRPNLEVIPPPQRQMSQAEYELVERIQRASRTIRSLPAHLQ